MSLPKAFIYKETIELLSSYTLDYPEIETGGELYGYWTNSGYPVIQAITGPGENVKRTTTFFSQDPEYLRSTFSWFNKQFGMQHLGSWHSHHKLGLARPSGYDINTVKKAMNTASLDRMFIIITTISERNVGMGGYYFKKVMKKDFEIVNWNIMEGKNPFRPCYPNLIIPPKKGFSGQYEIDNPNSSNFNADILRVLNRYESGRRFMTFLNGDLSLDEYDIISKMEDFEVGIEIRHQKRRYSFVVDRDKLIWRIIDRDRRKEWKANLNQAKRNRIRKKI